MSPTRYFCALSASAITLLAGIAGWSNPAPADKPETWIEVRTPHFIVASNDGENTARRFAGQFEQIRFLYSKALNPGLHLDPGYPILIFAVRNEKALSQLIPEYWVQKGHTHPAGLFVPGPEKNYIALRTEVESEFPYLAIYHEYVHLIINLNYQHFPVWLNEGFADFLGSATLTGRGGKLGQPSSWDLDLLQQTKLLPLQTLFKVDHQSPYYNEANKTTIFYAESWALVHYLMVDPEKQKNQALSKYISFVESGADPVEAATRAFGDLAQLQKALQSYINRTSYMEYSVALDSKSALAYFYHAMLLTSEGSDEEQITEARTALEKAVALNPSLGSAWSNLALLYANAGALDNALNAATRAVDTMPGDPHFQYNLAVVLARMERYDEARAVARKLQASGNSDLVSVTGKFLTQLDQAQQYAQHKKMNESNSAAATAINH